MSDEEFHFTAPNLDPALLLKRLAELEAATRENQKLIGQQQAKINELIEEFEAIDDRVIENSTVIDDMKIELQAVKGSVIRIDQRVETVARNVHRLISAVSAVGLTTEIIDKKLSIIVTRVSGSDFTPLEMAKKMPAAPSE